MGKSFDDLAAALAEELGEALRSVDPGDVDRLRRAILRAERVFVAGKGRSGLQVRGFAMRLMHLGLRVHVLGDVTTPAIAEGDLLLIGSGSGRTRSLVGHAERAKELGARVALITAARSSPIAARADHVVHIAAGRDEPTSAPNAAEARAAVPTQPMGSLFEQALGAVLDIVILQLMDEMDVGVEEMFARHANLE